MSPRAVVTGGAGFVGSHLCDRLLAEGWEVLCVDSFLTGAADNLAGSLEHEGFRLQEASVSDELAVDGPVDWVLHFASAASPRDYLEYPIQTLKSGSLGTMHCLGLAKAKGAGLLLASTSEVYGDPLVHPQPESYWGNVNPVGPRSVYDEAKRYAEAITMAYHRVHDVPVKIVRIFNTYGPRMRRNDGRAVPTFLSQALAGEPMTVHGDGRQTRSLCYVDDLVEGVWRMLTSTPHTGPLNLGADRPAVRRDLQDDRGFQDRGPRRGGEPRAPVFSRRAPRIVRPRPRVRSCLDTTRPGGPGLPAGSHEAPSRAGRVPAR
jgi:nucleoside-diphosphate-sugar epimerase